MVCQKRVDSIFESPEEHQIKNSKIEIGEDDGRMEHAEGLLAKWIECQNHLPKNYDKKMVRNFLRGAKHDLEKAKRKLEAHFVAKDAFPEIYTGRNPHSEELNRTLDTTEMVFLPKLNENGDRISIFRVRDPDVTKFDVTQVCKSFFMIYDLLMTAEPPIAGEIAIFDCKHVSSAHIAKLLSSSFKTLLLLLKDAYAIRVKQLHIVNAPSLIDKLLMAIRPFLHEKVKKRFVIHKDEKSLLKHVDASLLPSDLGGELGTMQEHSDKWRQVIRDNHEWYREQENIKVIGTPPSKKFQQFQNQIGVEGSFRKLSID